MSLSTVASEQVPQNEQLQIRHFSLPSMLPLGQKFVVTLEPMRRYSSLSLIGVGADGPVLLKHKFFSICELHMLVPLLEVFPQYCPYEYLLASFYTGGIMDEDTIMYYQGRVQHALARGHRHLDRELGHMRNMVSRTRRKLRSFGWEIKHVFETGYLLKPMDEMCAQDLVAGKAV